MYYYIHILPDRAMQVSRVYVLYYTYCRDSPPSSQAESGMGNHLRGRLAHSPQAWKGRAVLSYIRNNTSQCPFLVYREWDGGPPKGEARSFPLYLVEDLGGILYHPQFLIYKLLIYKIHKIYRIYAYCTLRVSRMSVHILVKMFSKQ